MRAKSEEVKLVNRPDITITMTWAEAQGVVHELGKGTHAGPGYDLFYILDDIVNEGRESSECEGGGR